MASKHKPAVEASDDLDDLDDILDEFNEPAQSTSTTAVDDAAKSVAPQPSSSSATVSADVTDTDADGELDEDLLNEQFARELAQGMEALMKGMNPDALNAAGAAANGVTASGSAPGAASDAGAEADGQEGLMNEDEMMKQFEQMMADMGFGGPSGGGSGSGASAAGPSSATTAGSGTGGPAQPPANFQDAIRSTMSRLRQSDQTATSSAGQNNEMDLEKLMAAFGNVEGAEGEEGIANMLENMMSELMSKEVLYDPLKELRDKYPAYLANPPAALTPDDRARYENQQRIVTSVVATFDDPKFDNGTEAEKKALKSQVQTLMNEMQDSGAPPQEIIGDLPPELENVPGLGGDENCTVM